MANLLTIKEIMARFKVSRTTVYRWLEKGMPVEIQVGFVKRFDEEKVIEWLKEQK